MTSGQSTQTFDFQHSELVLGLVAPVGTDLDLFQNILSRCLRRYRYVVNPVHLSKLIGNFKVQLPLGALATRRSSPQAKRLHKLMHEGDCLRLAAQNGGFLAFAAAQAILHQRKQKRPPENVFQKTAHVLRSLKHPDEVQALRRIYGNAFYLIGVTAEKKTRGDFLRDQRGCSGQEIEALLRRDEHEQDPNYYGLDEKNYGQRTRDTFHMADVFVPLNSELAIRRFLDLVFSCPFKTPSPDEYAMFLAFASSLRSGDLSRQVGAVLVSERGDVVGVGANDVACPGGGLYWPDNDRFRDIGQGRDSNEVQRAEIVDNVLKLLHPLTQSISLQAWLNDGKRALRDALLMDITEYGRATHAEMEALFSCARSGSKYPPAEPGALGCEPLKAAVSGPLTRPLRLLAT